MSGKRREVAEKIDSKGPNNKANDNQDYTDKNK